MALFAVLTVAAGSLFGQSQSTIRINAGGPAYVDPSGNQWAVDSGYSGGSVYSVSTSIGNTTTGTLYQSARYNSGNLAYNFSVPNGSYLVRLMFAETYFTAANSRVFNIALNGTTVQSNFDIFAAAGASATAVDRTYPVTVQQGQISISLAQVVQNPMISAIQITPGARVDAGASAPYTDPRGMVWQPDSSSNGTAYVTTANISNTDSAPLYQTLRYQSSGLQYSFPVPNGNYTVKFKFAETYFTSSGRRIFSAAINGVTVNPSIDVYAAAGGANTAIDMSYPAQVANGSLTLSLTPMVDYPIVSAIEIVPAAAVVSVTPGLVSSLIASQSQQFTAVVTGTPDTTVIWSVVPNIGTVASTGAYTAPASVGAAQKVQIIATSHANPAISASAVINLVPGAVVVLTPGTTLETAVAQQPAGTTFLLKAGIYRLQSIAPLNNDTFIGEPSMPTAQGVGTVISGAKVLTGFVSSGAYWVISGQTQQESVYGACLATSPMCGHTDDLFLDNNVLTRVAALSGMTAGQWYFDTTGGNIYMANNPAGHTIETSITPVAFFGSASGVTITGLTVEKYACPAQFGAIGNQYPGPAWTVTSSEIRWNHGTGLSMASGSQALNNFIHNNGQKGLGAGYWGVPATNVTISGNEISFNNYAGFDPSWEAGGTKFWQTTNLLVTGNNVHDNLGSGLWADTDNINTIYDGNTVTNNEGPGIQHEVSFAAIIRNNIVKGNGPNPGNWLWQSQILIQNSQNVQVYNNTVVATATNGNGIGIINQNRGSSTLLGLPYVAINNYVHDNDVTYHAGSLATTGIVADYNAAQTLNGNNYFDTNHYHFIVSPSYPGLWQWNQPVTWSSWQAFGQDIHGTVDSNIVQ